MINCIADKDKKLFGVYIIRNNIPGDERVYIGSTIQGFQKRFIEHNTPLKNNKHWNRHLQNFYNKYPNSLYFNVLEIVYDKDTVLEREQYYLDSFKTKFNIATDAKASMRGKKFTDEHKIKLGLAQKGRIVKDSTKKLIGIANKGKKRTADQIEKIRLSMIGRKRPESFKKTMSLSSPRLKSKSVIQYDLDGNFLYCYKSQKATGFDVGSIGKACNGKVNTVGGYKWKWNDGSYIPQGGFTPIDRSGEKQYIYENNKKMKSIYMLNNTHAKGRKHTKEAKEKIRKWHLNKPRSLETIDKIKVGNIYRSKKIEQYNIDGELLNTYISIREASRKTGIARTVIKYSLEMTNKPKKFIWKYSK